MKYYIIAVDENGVGIKLCRPQPRSLEDAQRRVVLLDRGWSGLRRHIIVKEAQA
jgi:hypothetical protein